MPKKKTNVTYLGTGRRKSSVARVYMTPGTGKIMVGEKTLEECIESLKTETRHYAKRQLTWFRKNR